MERVLREKLPGGDFRNVTPARSRAMSAVRGKGNASTERRFRLALVRAGIGGWKLHLKEIAGCPDFFFAHPELAVFTDGCFWHGCPKCGHLPSSNSGFWRAKIERNRLRDMEITEKLRVDGIEVLRFWEHELRDDLVGCVGIVRERLNRAEQHLLMPHS